MSKLKQEYAARARAALEQVQAQRLSQRSDRRALEAVKAFQSQRMARTHAALLAAADTRAAAHFFLDDLYGIHDQSRRDADLARVIPAMQKLLPAAALETVANAIVLDALSEMLDVQMAVHLGDNFSEADYIAAYPRVTARADREQQLALVRQVGDELCGLVGKPLLGGTLHMMRKPAQLAGLGELQQFLERGFDAFKAMKAPRVFVDTVVGKEARIMARLYAGERQPFRLDA